MSPTDVLYSEHEIILDALSLLERAVDRLGDSDVSASDLGGLVDFLASFADDLHHTKEEQLLFPALGQAGLPAHGGPVAVMLMEHEHGRAFLSSMRRAADDWGNDAARGAFEDAALGYVELLRQHIHKENQILFPMAERALSEAAKATLSAEFTKHDETRRKDEHERCRVLLERLKGVFA